LLDTAAVLVADDERMMTAVSNKSKLLISFYELMKCVTANRGAGLQWRCVYSPCHEEKTEMASNKL
jgi:hypothetical protein